MFDTQHREATVEACRSVLDDALDAAARRKRAEADQLILAVEYAELCVAAADQAEQSDAEQSEAEQIGKTAAESAGGWGSPDQRLALVQAASVLHGEQRVALGGPGTPAVPEFCHFEYAARLGLRPETAVSFIATGLALKHRLPQLWQLTRTTVMPVWVATKVANTTSDLTLAQARALSVEFAGRWGRVSTTAFLDAVKADVLRVTSERELTHAEQALASRTVKVRQDEHTAEVQAVMSKVDGLWLDQQVQRIATILGKAGDTSTREVRLSKALGVLASPARALQLLQASLVDEADDPELPTVLDLDDHEHTGCPAAGQRGHLCGQIMVDPDLLMPLVNLVVHLTDTALSNTTASCTPATGPDAVAVARTSHLGPQLADTVREWLGHARVVVRPVLDTAKVVPSSAYETPPRMRELIELRNPTSVFPFSTRNSRGLDLDHTTPYRAGGPPGQTRPDNLGPLTRKEHRAKTHGGWTVKTVPQPASADTREGDVSAGETSAGSGHVIFEWRSPLGYRYHVDGNTTHALDPTPTTDTVEDRFARLLHAA